MPKIKMVLGLVGAFVLGCAAIEVAPLVVPPARAGTAPQRWENTCTSNIEKDPRKVSDLADRYGQQGWQLGAAIPSGEFWAILCFTRPLP